MERTLESTVLHVTRTRLVMSWDGAHVHRFCIRGREFGVYRPGSWLFSGDPEAIYLPIFASGPTSALPTSITSTRGGCMISG
jgi:hypothetical protein